MIQEYNLYKVSGRSFQPSDELVEGGLSAGEVRQALLDRMNHDTPSKVTRTLWLHLMDVPQREASKIEKLDDLLYNLSDEKLADSSWPFSNEHIFVQAVRG